MDQSALASNNSCSTKVERRIIEKNRRNQMKFLYSKLYSLLPNDNPKETMALPDQIEKAIEYIKRLEEKVKMGQEKKDSLLLAVGMGMGMRIGRKRSCSCVESETKGGISQIISSPKMEIRETNSSLEIVLITALDNHFIFYDIIRILHQENIDVVAANSSLAGDGNLMHHVLHAQMQQSSFELGGSKVSERLRRFVYGSASSNVEMQQDLWDFDNIAFEPWGLDLLNNISMYH